MSIPQDISALHMCINIIIKTIWYSLYYSSSILYLFSSLTHKYIFAVRCGMRRLLLATSHLGAYKVNRLDIPSPPTQEKKFCIVNVWWQLEVVLLSLLLEKKKFYVCAKLS